MKRWVPYLLAAAMVFAVLAFSNNFPEQLEGRAVKIADGDTFTLLTTGKTQVKIRLNGIDAPEKGQDYWVASKDFLGKLLAGRSLRVRVTGKDRYGRLIGDVYVDRLWVNSSMVEAGLAWHFLKYSHDPELAKAEAEARKQLAGLWKQPGAIPPWEFRAQHKKKQ
jgi:endonuclease YncB( thermonuclease family)